MKRRSCSSAGRPGGLLLESAERPKVALGIDDPFHGGDAERTDQLVLEVCVAHVEAERLQPGAREVRPEAGLLEGTPEVALLRDVAQPRQLDAEPPWAERIQELR